MKRVLIAALIVECLSLLCGFLHAQQPTGSITGLVTDPSAAVIPGAAITVTNKATDATVKLTTTEAGVYTASSLLPGAYEVRVEAPGFKTTIVELTVEVGRATPADVRLEVGPVAETVTVQAHAVVVNPTQTTLEGVITGNLIRDLPLNGRNFLDLGQLEPGVQIQDAGNFFFIKSQFVGLSVGGQSGVTTRVTVDGLDISDEHLGTVAQNISQDSIQEFQISRSSLDLSAGLTGGGAVNVVGKTGANDMHGSAFFFWRDDTFAARVGQESAPFDREQGGFSLGGPFIRDRLFWFVSYERNNQDGASSTNIAGFPQYSGTWPVPYDDQMASARMDWNLTRNVRSFFRFTHNSNVGLPAGQGGLGGTTVSPVAIQNNSNHTGLGLDAGIGRSTHSFRYGYLKYRLLYDDAYDRVPGLPGTLDPRGRPLMVAFGLFGLFGGSPQVGPHMNTPGRISQSKHESRYDGSLVFGRHAVRWGALVNVIRANWFESVWGNAPEVDIGVNASTQAICGDDLRCYPVTSAVLGNGLGFMSGVPALGLPYGGFKNTRLHWYLGDGWRASSRLNINYGLRYVYEPGQSNPSFDKPALLDEFRPGLSRHNRRDKNNFAPQLGIAWDPSGSGKWVVRGGAGVFYDTNLLKHGYFETSNLIPSGVTFDLRLLPFQRVTDPTTGAVIFDMSGSDLTASVTPGVNWMSGCADPRYPGGACPLGTPGLIDAIFAAWDAFRASSLAATANFPAGPSQFETTRSAIVLDPDYRTPYTFQFNVGVQRELRPGLVLSADYVRHRGLHYPMRRDFNRLGAADTLNVTNARAAMDSLHTALGCPLGPAGVDCALATGATIDDYAVRGLGSGEGASSLAPNPFAFPGLDLNFNKMQVLGMQGQNTYNGLHVALRGHLPDVGRLVRDWNLIASYSLSRLEGTVVDQGIINLSDPVNNDKLMQFSGPTTLDRTHMLSVANLFAIPGGVRLSSIWRAFSSLPQSVIVPQVSGGFSEIFRTDFNGDGAVGDALPGTNRGSYGRDIGCGASNLNRVIDTYNTTQAGHVTPAGQALVDAGLFTASQLQSLGAVSPTVAQAPAGQVCLDSFATVDVRISRPLKLREGRLTVEPVFEWFNVFNIANYDLPGNKLSGLLTGTPGSINGTTRANRSNRAGFGTGSFAAGIPRSWQFALRVTF
jgi:hypothetical protein